VVVEAIHDKSWQFDEVILAIPSPQIAKLCPQLSSAEKSRFRQGLYQGLICASVLLKKPLAGYYYTNITDKRTPFTGLVEMTGLVSRDYFGGNSLVYLPRYMTPDDPFWKKSDKQIADVFLNALKLMYPTLDKQDVLSYSVSKAPEIMPVVTLNYSRDLLPATKTSLQHVFVVNSAQIVDGTWNVNEVVALANRKAEEITKLISAGGTRS
jgi:protoporphyrinogen oxidase